MTDTPETTSNSSGEAEIVNMRPAATFQHIEELHQRIGQLAQQISAPPSDWALHVGGQPMMRPIAGKEPCALYRWLQRVFLGLDWRRVA